jgi:hypothetical protein
MRVVNATWGLANAAMCLYPVTTPVAVLSTTANVVTNLAVPGPGQDGSSRAEIAVWQQRFGRLGEGTSYQPDGGTLKAMNGTPGSVRQDGLQHIRMWDTLFVGEQLSVWVHLVSQVQLRAEDGQSGGLALATWLPAEGEAGTVHVRVRNATD